MKSIQTIALVSLSVVLAVSAGTIYTLQARSTSAAVAGGEYATSTTAALGYDVVAYQAQGGPVRGSGDDLAVYNGETFLFSSGKNRKLFEADPAKYAPAYGGYCAYGVSVGKKFVGDPEVWKIVDGRLYLNLNKDVQKTWQKDIPGNIVKAEEAWPTIAEKSPSEL